MTRHPARPLDEWSTRYVARRDIIDVEVSATAEDLDRVVAEVRAAKGWPSQADRLLGRVLAAGAVVDGAR